MYKQFYEGMDLTHLPLFTLILFIAVFLAAVIRMFVLHRAADYEQIARLPLGDNDE